ncbi:hypothetical protein AMTR_s04226p00007190 [Amborella trichopoda]|uniref:Uncharacterized protein n=1 Tax=Amborella trichopoda TaxID=13333 RepID=U5CKI1_AMBTC|nr:hypothetical protein AMTR_s04226p00007190 [Amborella trichopoda]
MAVAGPAYAGKRVQGRQVPKECWRSSFCSKRSLPTSTACQPTLGQCIRLLPRQPASQVASGTRFRLAYVGAAALAASYAKYSQPKRSR